MTEEVWRRDFPTDWPQDHFVARRDFVKFLVLTSLGFSVGQACICMDSVLSKNKGFSPQAITRLEEISIGSSLPFNFPGPHDPCLLMRLDETTLVAYSQKCTHLACALVPQPEKKRLYCPCHEGAFDIRDGRPIQGPPRRPLPAIRLEIKDGVVYAMGVTASAAG